MWRHYDDFSQKYYKYYVATRCRRRRGVLLENKATLDGKQILANVKDGTQNLANVKDSGQILANPWRKQGWQTNPCFRQGLENVLSHDSHDPGFQMS